MYYVLVLSYLYYHMVRATQLCFALGTIVPYECKYVSTAKYKADI